MEANTNKSAHATQIDMVDASSSRHTSPEPNTGPHGKGSQKSKAASLMLSETMLESAGRSAVHNDSNSRTNQSHNTDVKYEQLLNVSI